MKRTVDVFELSRQAGSLEGQVDSAELARLAPMLARPSGPIRFQIRGRTDERGRSAASLDLQGRLSLACDLCGSELDWPLQAQAGFFFVQDENELGALPILVDGDEPLVGSRDFDLLDLLEEQTILSLPISPRHPGCERPDRSDRNEGDAGTHPFAQLAALKRGRTDVK